jgi:rod shape-determining protein MreD
MKKTIQKTSEWIFCFIPVMTVLLSIFIGAIPFQLSQISLLMPLASYITIYFWSVYRPQSLPYFALLLLGLFKDVIESNVLGFNPLAFLLFQAMVKSQSKYIVNKAFIVVWAGFVFCLAVILFLPLLSIKVNAEVHIYPFNIILSQWLITIFVYVPIHYLLDKLNNLRSKI